MILETVLCIGFIIFLIAFGGEVALMWLIVHREHREAENNNKVVNEQAEQIKKYTSMEQNKYASMTLSELEPVLQSLYSQQLSIISAQLISENDPNARDILYAKSLEAMITYLGPETIEALDYYYGKNFITRWCETKYFLLENAAVISEIIDNKTIRSAQISKAME